MDAADTQYSSALGSLLYKEIWVNVSACTHHVIVTRGRLLSTTERSVTSQAQRLYMFYTTKSSQYLKYTYELLLGICSER
jgi:hypothetical protein